MSLDFHLNNMWQQYIAMTPLAKDIVDLLESEGETIINDHIALRTFNDKRVGIDHMSKTFKKYGYEEKGEYHFEQKKLYAKHFEHPDEKYPKVFISELLLEEFSSSLQEEVKKCIDQLSSEDLGQEDFTYSGRKWNVDVTTYKSLLKESEYAAWLAAFGYRPNHFTIFINKLSKFQDIVQLNSFLKSKGFKLNSSGGEVKGSPDVYLEQSSTLADKIKVSFSDEEMVIPSCYFEFAKRYNDHSGKLYQGFVSKSADKIFESTDTKS